MSDTLARVQALAKQGEVRISLHGYDELSADDIYFSDVLGGLAAAAVVEDYPHAAVGPSVLVLQQDSDHRPIHVVWGIAKDRSGPAVLVTAYRPDPLRWSDDFMRRRRS
ncbi:MAG: DUF4258 domain-containing protein [Xanthobacteraceae bacterium]